MNNQVVVGHAFIVPNQVTRLERDFTDPEWQMEKLRRLCGIKASYSDRLIQIWITSENTDNWSDNFGGFQKEIGKGEPDHKTRDGRLIGYFPKFFPVEVFDKKMEGDEVTLECPEYDITIKLICKQLDYRYKSFGRFEEVYHRLV